MLLLCFASTPYQTQAQQPVTQSNAANDSARSGDELSNLVARLRPRRRAGFALMAESYAANLSGPVFNITPTVAAGPNLTVMGGGTVGRLTKWTGFNSSNSFIGDSTIYEDKFGKVGMGTDTPTSKLTVAGMIQSTSGGIKFPDGTVQTSSATGALFTVAQDATLTGNGTTGSPLGVAVPLILSGTGGLAGIIQATNTSDGGNGMVAQGGNSNGISGGDGVVAQGGNSNGISGGDGVVAQGGKSNVLGGVGGSGVIGKGGESDNGAVGAGGVGVQGGGGNSASGAGGNGMIAAGGNSTSGNGGQGILVSAGFGNGAGNRGGIGIEATGGGGLNGATTGLAGKFNGNVQVSGTLSKGGGSFKIDHPLDPENRYLYHSFVESPDMKNIYDGNVVTDENGEAVVVMPEYFEALNRDVRYQLTVIGTFAQAIVANEIKGNRFVIRTNAPNVKVSWQVTGVRQDAFANRNRIPVEEDKPEAERGYYLHPEAFDQPEEKSVSWARDPERMQQLRQRRIEAEQTRKQQR
jgi:hypothetical protein